MPERFSASVAARIMACPASANLELALHGWQAPVEDRTADNAANQGTSLHEVLAKLNELTPSELTAMIEVLTYIRDLRAGRRFKKVIEQTFTATWLQTQPQTTPDLVLHTADELHLIDFKWGKIPVDVIDNAQLLFGAATVSHLAPKAQGVHCHILQPRAGGCEHWYADTLVLKQFVADAQEAEAKVIAGDLTYGPSDHCKFCPAYPHSRGAKGNLMCPATMKILGYQPQMDEDEILGL